MVAFTQVHDRAWVEYFVRAGYRRAAPLAAGVQGAVYQLDDATVAKVWARRPAADLLPWQAFYADLTGAGLPFATPVILRIEEIDGVAVSYERRLPGQPLQQRLAPEGQTLDVATVDCVLTVLDGLAHVAATEAMRRLPALDERQPLWAGAVDFPTALGALIQRRMSRFGGVLAGQVPDLAVRVKRLVRGLAEVDRVPDRVIHGDLFGENILVDDLLRPAAVLDFGFLTTAGDPRFEAGITAMIMNMYGPHGPTITQSLHRTIAAELGYRREVMSLYAAAYAVATANAFTPDGNDGHFPWCLAQLTRPDVTAVLGMGVR